MSRITLLRGRCDAMEYFDNTEIYLTRCEFHCEFDTGEIYSFEGRASSLGVDEPEVTEHTQRIEKLNTEFSVRFTTADHYQVHLYWDGRVYSADITKRTVESQIRDAFESQSFADIYPYEFYRRIP